MYLIASDPLSTRGGDHSAVELNGEPMGTWKGETLVSNVESVGGNSTGSEGSMGGGGSKCSGGSTGGSMGGGSTGVGSMGGGETGEGNHGGAPGDP